MGQTFYNRTESFRDDTAFGKQENDVERLTSSQLQDFSQVLKIGSPNQGSH